MGEKTGSCWHCGRVFDDLELAREAVCAGCGKALHACRNCVFYRPGRANDCLEPIADHVVDKQRPNFCDYFKPHRGAYQADAVSGQDLLAAAEDLFK